MTNGQIAYLQIMSAAIVLILFIVSIIGLDMVADIADATREIAEQCETVDYCEIGPD